MRSVVNKPALTLLVPFRNEERNLPDLIHSIGRQVFSFPWEVILIDHQSSDRSVSIIKSCLLESRMNDNIKFRIVKARSQTPINGVPLREGIRLASAKFIGITDADCVLRNNWATEMLTGLRRHPICVGKTETYFSVNPGKVELVADALFKNFSKLAAEARGFAMPWGPGCNLGFRREVYERVGEFTSKVPSYDMDWGWRATQLGLTVSYLPKAVVYHKRRKSVGGLKSQWYAYGTSEPWIFQKYLVTPSARNGDNSLPERHARAAALRIIKYYSKKGVDAKILKVVAWAYAKGILDGYKLLKF